MAERIEIENAVIDAVAEAYGIEKSKINLVTRYKEDLGVTSVKVLKTALFIGENLDLDEDLAYEDIADAATLNDTVEMLVKKLS